MDLSLTLANVTKTYPSSKFTLGPVSYSFAAGDCIAILGANGAGKSTLFQILSGSLDLSGGDIRIGKEKILPENFLLKRKIGYLPQDLPMPRWVNAEELLSYAAELFELDKVTEEMRAAENYWDYGSYRKKPLATCSYGMQKRVALALATIHDPAILILDEPFSGLDLFHIRALEILLQRRAKNKSYITILSTHVAHFAARLCNRAFVIQAGKLEEIPDWLELDEMARITAVEAKFF